MTNIFSINEVVNYSWEKVKKHLWFFILMSLVVFLVSYIPNIVNDLTTTKENPFSIIGFLVSLIFWFLQIIISIGVIRICLDIVYGKTENPKIKDLFSHANLFIKYLAASILMGLIIVIPLAIVMLLFVVSLIMNLGAIVNIILAIIGMITLVFMIIYSIRFGYYGYYIVEGSGIVESLKNSFRITKGKVWSLVVLGFVLGLINFLGILCLGVGLLVTVPISYVASAYVYKKLKEADSGLITPTQEVKPQI